MISFLIYATFIISIALFSNSSSSTIVLLDNNQSKNGILVTTQAGQVILDEPYTAVELKKEDQIPSPLYKIDKSDFEKKYRSVIEALPKKPVSTLFYFKTATIELTEESCDKIKTVTDLIKASEPATVDIIAHTDTQGSAEENFELGLKRAEIVRLILEEKEVKMKKVNIRSFGECDPLIPTADGVSELKNRRVEIIVR